MVRTRNINLAVLATATSFLPYGALAQTPLHGSPSPTVTGPSAAESASPAAPTPPAGGAAASAESGIQDIVVTARRTEESLQSTPVAVTALGTASLVRAQVVNAVDLQRTAPSLVVARGAPSSSGFTYVSIRGQGNLNPGVANDPAVGTYVDGVYIARPSQGVTDLLDLQRVEVLRGPQGTLFGRNTTGGALNILTNNPTDKFEVTIKGEVGNYDYRDAGAVVNVPIKGDEVDARFVYNYRDHSGYARNLALGRDQNDETSHFARAKLKIAPAGSAFSVILSGDYNSMKDSGIANSLGAFDPNATFLSQQPGAGAFFPGFYAQLAPYLHTKNAWYRGYSTGLSPNARPDGGKLPFDKLTAWGVAANAKIELNDVTIKSITGYRYSNARGLIDIDGTPIDILPTLSGYLSRAFSQELQASGHIGNKFTYIGGMYYSRETGHEFSRASVFGGLNSYIERQIGLPAGALGAPKELLNDADVTNTSMGAFAQGYYDITEKIHFSAGLRWTWDKRKVVLHNLLDVTQPSNAIIASASGAQINCVVTPDNGNPANCNQTRDAKFNYPAFTVGLDYQVSDSLFVYAKSSRASKAGGWNLRQGSEATPAFAPERAQDVEAGFKYTTPDRVFRLNAAAFQTWTSEVQRNAAALVNGVTTQFLRNAGKTRIHGVEFEATLAPVQGFEINGNLAMLRGHYKSGTFLSLDPVTGAPVDRSGEKLPQLPKAQFGIGATYTARADYGAFVFHTDYAYVGAQYFNPITAPAGLPPVFAAQYAIQNRETRIPGYGLLNGRVSFSLANTGLEFAVFARNILQKKYLTRTFADLYVPLGISVDYVGDPRTYGLSITYKFGSR